MMLRTLLPALVALGCASQLSAADVEFNRDVRPILSDACYACHGPDARARKAELRLDTKEGLADETVVVPGQSAKSGLFQRITAADPSEVMPPPKSGKKLTPKQVETIKKWIDQGAKYEGHWAFEPIRRPTPPAGAKHPVDAFVRTELARQKLTPSREADRVTLIRRLSFDLTGLPPKPADVAAFVADKAPDAYERLVDRLLASPHYGERMAMVWLDLVRYADSVGYHGDQPVSVWPYRDWVIQAFNDNMPFDRFTVEQLAGDLLPDPTLAQKVAAGYNRIGMMSAEGGVQPKEYLTKYAAERVRNLGGAWLGVTLGCSECHDHKFDPFSLKDFYRMEAFFADIQEQGIYGGGNFGPFLPVPTAAEQSKLDRLESAVSSARTKAERPGVAFNAVAGGAAVTPARRELLHAEQAHAAFLKTIPVTLATVRVPPRTIRILPRGNWMDDSGEVVTPQFPDALPKPPAGKTRPTRLDLARWVVSKDNPLTARTLSNRLWKMYFGAGLSRKLDDLGAQGEWPTHPLLLDYLASRLIDSGWDVKAQVKLLVTSETYRQSSATSTEVTEKDPYNRWFARQARFRLDAELVRDNALAISGLLVEKIGGPSVHPYQPPGYWSYLNFPTREWKNDAGDKLYRRGLYTHWQRQYLHPSLMAFDAPSREECTAERVRSNTPLQALVLLNDPTYVEAARALAARAIEAADSDAGRLDWMYRRAVSRPAKPAEREVLVELLKKHRAEYKADPKAAKALLAVGAKPAADGIDPAELAAWTSVARTVLNLHEAVTRK
ncbi:MAG TPA: PSD1 and planctomycete cytochrome C domain-containing protein [Fimbriiglobus sp.]|nr:PSD1 and planctomycete cytochrome C domain-containing protein [Fimbriiglobus sp.]